MTTNTHERARSDSPASTRRSTARDAGRINAPVTRPTAWWLATLRKRAATMYQHEPADLHAPMDFADDAERAACVAFFNAAYRAEESGLSQAHRLADEVRGWDPELAECLVLYGNEEGWHRALLEQFLGRIGGVRPMGRVTGGFYDLYARARRMETVMLTNLMFETIGATTYRLALARVRQPAARAMLTVLTRDESFHVPLNVHFIREIMRQKRPSRLARARLGVVYQGVFAALLASTLASRPVARGFDGIGQGELARAYAGNLGRLFMEEADLAFEPPWLLLHALGIRRDALGVGPSVTSASAAEHAADRSRVVV